MPDRNTTRLLNEAVRTAKKRGDPIDAHTLWEEVAGSNSRVINFSSGLHYQYSLRVYYAKKSGNVTGFHTEDKNFAFLFRGDASLEDIYDILRELEDANHGILTL